MAYSLVYPNKFALKLKIHSKICEKELKNMLLKIQGVHSVKIDEKLGNLVISGTVDPATIITMLEKLGRKPELLWVQGIPINGSQVHEASRVHAGFEEGRDSKHVQIITQSKVINSLNDPDIITQLEQLSRIPGLQTIEVTETIKLSLQGESRNELPGDDKILDISTSKNVNGDGFCRASSSCCGDHADINRRSHSHRGCCRSGDDEFLKISTTKNVNGGGFGGASLPCCGDHADINRNSHSHSHHGCCCHSGNTSFQHAIPSAPPLPFEYFQTPPSPQSSSSPSMPITYHSVFSDENVNGCIIV
ncbi:hypothetical protein BC332_14211 [Capsicum chinense]|nr:hypothetical protein BC332_14211 [Capsicum chinense]